MQCLKSLCGGVSVKPTGVLTNFSFDSGGLLKRVPTSVPSALASFEKEAHNNKWCGKNGNGATRSWHELKNAFNAGVEKHSRKSRTATIVHSQYNTTIVVNNSNKINAIVVKC